MIVVVCPGQGSQTPGFLTPWLAENRFREQLEAISDTVGDGFQPFAEPILGEPRGEESWSLGALTRAHDDDHPSSLLRPGRHPVVVCD